MTLQPLLLVLLLLHRPTCFSCVNWAVASSWTHLGMCSCHSPVQINPPPWPMPNTQQCCSLACRANVRTTLGRARTGFPSSHHLQLHIPNSPDRQHLTFDLLPFRSFVSNLGNSGQASQREMLCSSSAAATSELQPAAVWTFLCQSESQGHQLVTWRHVPSFRVNELCLCWTCLVKQECPFVGCRQKHNGFFSHFHHLCCVRVSNTGLKKREIKILLLWIWNQAAAT